MNSLELQLMAVLNKLDRMYHQRDACKFNGKDAQNCVCGLKEHNATVEQGRKLLELLHIEYSAALLEASGQTQEQPIVKETAQVAYEAYAANTDFDGREMPKWSDLHERTVNAWRAAVRAVLHGEEKHVEVVVTNAD